MVTDLNFLNDFKVGGGSNEKKTEQKTKSTKSKNNASVGEFIKNFRKMAETIRDLNATQDGGVEVEKDYTDTRVIPGGYLSDTMIDTNVDDQGFLISPVNPLSEIYEVNSVSEDEKKPMWKEAFTNAMNSARNLSEAEIRRRAREKYGMGEDLPDLQDLSVPGSVGATEDEVFYTYKKGDTFGQVIKDLGLNTNKGLWGSDGDVAYYTKQLREQGIPGMIPIGKTIRLKPRK